MRISPLSFTGVPIKGVAVLSACLLLASSAQLKGEITGQRVPTVVGMVEDRFDNPEDIIKRFQTELAKSVGVRGLPSSEELGRQAETNKTCVVVTSPDPRVKLDPEVVYTRARPSVVIVGGISKCEDGQHWKASCASGFVAHKDGVIITNAHVVEAFRQMEAVGVMTDDGRVFPVKAVLAADAHNDVAVLKIDANNLPALPFAASASVGATVYCLSHPELTSPGDENGFFAFTKGMVCGKFRLRLGGDKLLSVLAITADYGKGSSGGPILNEHGAVVGMVSSTMALLDDSEGNVQMTWKFTRPSSNILSLLQGDKPAAIQRPQKQLSP